LFKEFETKLDARATPGVPDTFGDNRHAQAYYGAIRLTLGEEAFAALDASVRQQFVDQAFTMDKVVRNAIAENSLNPQNIEAAIRKGLLPGLFALVGLENAKSIVEQVIQITRVGLARE
jgi:type I restriction enzyme R subunit